MGRAWKRLGTGPSRPRPTEHLSPASLASSSPHQELNSARSPDVEKASPSGQGAAHPTHGQPGLPKSGVAPHPPPLRSPEFLPSPQEGAVLTTAPAAPLNSSSSSGPISSCPASSSISRSFRCGDPRTTPLPRLHACRRPRAPHPGRARRALPGGDCRSPSAIFLRQELDLTFHLRTHPSFSPCSELSEEK